MERSGVMKAAKKGKRKKAKTWSSKRFICCFLLFSFCFLILLCSCSTVGYFQAENFPYEELSTSYDRTKLRTDNTLDVLDMMHSPEYELEPNFAGTNMLSQSDIVIASSGQSKDSYKTWFNMIAFDEHRMTAKRKYFFLIDENKIAPTKFKRFLTQPGQGLVFDSQMVLQTEVLDKPYATEGARQLAILRQVAENFRKDINEICADANELNYGGRILTVSGMLMNQVFESVLFELDKSPALAVRLSDEVSDEGGVEFSHISFDNGKARMVVDNDIVTVKIRLGSPLY